MAKEILPVMKPETNDKSEEIVPIANTSKKPFSNLTLTNSIIIAMVPFVAYLYTYIFQYGYLNAFKIPLQFISISIIDVLITALRYLGFFF